MKATAYERLLSDTRRENAALREANGRLSESNAALLTQLANQGTTNLHAQPVPTFAQVQSLRGLLCEAEAHIKGRPMSMRAYTPERLMEAIEKTLKDTMTVYNMGEPPEAPARGPIQPQGAASACDHGALVSDAFGTRCARCGEPQTVLRERTSNG